MPGPAPTTATLPTTCSATSTQRAPATTRSTSTTCSSSWQEPVAWRWRSRSWAKLPSSAPGPASLRGRRSSWPSKYRRRHRSQVARPEGVTTWTGPISASRGMGLAAGNEPAPPAVGTDAGSVLVDSGAQSPDRVLQPRLELVDGRGFDVDHDVLAAHEVADLVRGEHVVVD